jgi:hypothetical protein
LLERLHEIFVHGEIGQFPPKRRHGEELLTQGGVVGGIAAEDEAAPEQLGRCAPRHGLVVHCKVPPRP